ncbi:AAA family ATPase [Histidinibacterium lentulum]|uniref:Chromosome segregation protein SMC n=1 Tax=Histidinibacterium lentulum TaxID=2480588 RepID=A0A3N2RA74_9RHOB|nr:AAA family ATPase [Histidinibacterium lentulum]ROU04364.1 chromosome segregation protein SMC [Histidinibacterium lentulum]
MRIRGLTLENVRKFAGRRVSFGGVGDGITVICEANEFGKSTFFDAIQAVAFEKYTSKGKLVGSLRPRAGGGVRIVLEIEVEGGRYAVEKRFLAKAGASVTDLARGVVIARDGEAEDWIARQVGAADQGPAGLLWVRQGVLGLEPADAKPAERERLTEARRDLLSSVAGEIEKVTGGRTMDRILRRCEDDLGLLATGSRLSPRGAWKESVESEKALAAELEVLERQCAELADALRERRATEAELGRIDDPEERLRRESDLNAAREAARAAESHAQKIAAARGERDLAAMQAAEALRRRDGLAEALKRVGETAEEVERADADAREARARLDTARGAETEVRGLLAEAEAAARALRAERTLAERADRVGRAREEAERLAAVLEQVRGHRAEAAAAKARVAGNPVTAEALSALEEAAREVARLRGATAAAAVKVTPVYSGTARVSLEGQALEAGVPVALEDGSELELPGIGCLRFDLPQGAEAEDAETRFAEALAAEDEALERCGVGTLAEARARAQTRQQDIGAAELADGLGRSLAPDGIERLEQALAAARAVTAEAAEGPVRPVEEISRDLEKAETREAELRGRLGAASEAVGAAREKVASAEAALAGARDRREAAEALAGEEDTRQGRLAALAAAAERAEIAARAADRAHAELTAGAPDAATAAANLKRAEASHENARRRREHLLERRADLSARIDTRAEEGVEERRNEVADRLTAARARAARMEAEVAALVRLREALTAARDGAREAYFEPVQEELRPLLRILHEDAGIDWETDSIMPNALRRGGETEEFETLSGGTQEQIAILTRLAFARLFARRGQHLPIILDDALVYSDDDRIVKMFTALNRVAMDQQIIVFSCRQMAFAGLGGDRPRMRMEEAG